MTVYLVAGLGYGDEGKGAAVDWLAAKHAASLVVRYNGGAQACHHVVRDDYTVHGFSQFGSGTFAGARTHLSEFVRFDPYALMTEAKHLEQLGVTNPLSLLTVDERCVVVTPYHVTHSQAQAAVHNRGTTGMGVGAAIRHRRKYRDEAIQVRDLRGSFLNIYDKLLAQERRFKDSLPDTWDHAADKIAKFFEDVGDAITVTDEFRWQEMLNHEHDTIIFEGAQGMMLDEHIGTRPYVTSSDTTFNNAVGLVMGYTGAVKRIGVMRTYMTRHGAGPFPTETDEIFVKELHNRSDGMAGAFRMGWLDLEALRHVVYESGGVDEIHVTHWDAVQPNWKVCLRGAHDNDEEPLYREIDRDNGRLWGWIEGAVGAPITLAGYGPRRKDRRE